MRKNDGIIVFKDWNEQNNVIEKKIKGIFIEKCPSNTSLCDVLRIDQGKKKKIGQIPIISLYGGGNDLRNALDKNIPGLAKDTAVIAISTRLNAVFNVK